MNHQEQTTSFGYWVRRRRQALDLTQSRLASLVGCASVTISKIERDERRPSREMALLLADHLSIDHDEDRARFLATARGISTPERLPLSTQPVEPTTPLAQSGFISNLPPADSASIHREQEERELTELLQTPGVQLVTLVGPGGVGKTHLAIQISRRLRDHFRDGVSFLSVEVATSEERILHLLAGHLGIRESRGTPLEQALLGVLASGRRLIVLDNFEQALDAADLIARLLAGAPGLRLLITSREPLRLRQERNFALPPFSVPDSASATPELLADSRAVRLFALRAREVDPSFELDEASTDIVAAICRLVDGLPLAIELAAAQLLLFSLPSLHEELSEGVDPSLDLLRTDMRDVPIRQRSMRSAIAWSVDLLSDAERQLFVRLSVFPGSFDLEAALAVGGVGELGRAGTSRASLLSILNSLVRKHLLQIEGEILGERRFRMLLPVREFGREVLEESEENEAIYAAHARWLANRVFVAHAEFGSAGYHAWLGQLELEMENLGGATEWLIGQEEVEMAYAMVARLWRFWWKNGRMAEGLYWIERARALSDEHVSPAERARLLLSESILRQVRGEHIRSSTLLKRTLRLADSCGECEIQVLARNYLGWVLSAQLHFSEAERILQEGVELARKGKFTWGLGMTLVGLGTCELAQEKNLPAEEKIRQGIGHLRALGDPLGLSFALSVLNRVLITTGDLQGAERAARESLEQGRRGQGRLEISFALHCLARVALLAQRYEEAARRITQSLRLRWSTGDRHGVAASLALAGLLSFRRGEYAQTLHLWEVAQRELERMDGHLFSLLSGLISEDSFEEVLAHCRKDVGVREAEDIRAGAFRQDLGSVVSELLEEWTTADTSETDDSNR